MRQFEVDKGFFGAAGSPLVEDGKVIANVGGKKAGIVAFDAKTGKVIWTATTDAASYSSGVAATMLGRRYAVFLTRAGLVGLDPANGQVRFQRPWRARQAASVNAATPVVVGNTIFVSAEYGPGAGVLQFDGTKLVDVWLSDEVLSNHYATSVFHDGTLYGFHGRQEFGPVFRAVDLQSGKVLWSTPTLRRRQRDARRQSAGDRARVRRAGARCGIAQVLSADRLGAGAAARLCGRIRRCRTAFCISATTTRLLRWISDETVLGSGFRGSGCRFLVPGSGVRVRCACGAESASAARSRRRRVRAGTFRAVGVDVRRGREGRFRTRRRSSGSAVSRFTTPGATPIAGGSSNRTGRSTRTMWRMPRGISCVWRASSRLTRRARRCCRWVRISASPMREVYQMFRGALTAEDVLKAAGNNPSGQFYAHLYIGLYSEALGRKDLALEAHQRGRIGSLCVRRRLHAHGGDSASEI